MSRAHLDETLKWEPLPGHWTPESKVQKATAGEWSAIVWKSVSRMRPWRGKLRRNENDYRQVRCYRTEEGAKSRMEDFLWKAAS